MQVADIMQKDVTVTKPDELLRYAAERMQENDVGGLPVVADGVLVGMLTDRDIAIRGDAFGKDPMVCTVEDVMSTKVVYCYETEDVGKAADLMKREQIRRLPVVARDKRKLVGIITVSDIAGRVDDEVAGEIIENTAHFDA